jgi:hypothetical protein
LALITKSGYLLSQRQIDVGDHVLYTQVWADLDVVKEDRKVSWRYERETEIDMVLGRGRSARIGI